MNQIELCVWHKTSWYRPCVCVCICLKCVGLGLDFCDIDQKDPLKVKVCFFFIHKQWWVPKHVGFTSSAFWRFLKQVRWLSLHKFFVNIALKAVLFLTNDGISEQWYCIEKVLKAREFSWWWRFRTLLLSQQGLVCEDTRVRFYLTLPGAVGGTVAYLVLQKSWGNGTCSGGETVQNPVYHSRYRSGGTEQCEGRPSVL